APVITTVLLELFSPSAVTCSLSRSRDCLCSRLFRFCELCAVCVESTVLPVRSLRFGANVFQHTEMDLVNDVIRPQMPILCRPHRVVIPGRTFQASAPSR